MTMSTPMNKSNLELICNNITQNEQDRIYKFPAPQFWLYTLYCINYIKIFKFSNKTNKYFIGFIQCRDCNIWRLGEYDTVNMKLTSANLIDRQQFSNPCNLIVFLSFCVPSLFFGLFSYHHYFYKLLQQ